MNLFRNSGRVALSVTVLVVAAAATGCASTGAGTGSDARATGPATATSSPSSREDARPMTGAETQPEPEPGLPDLGPETSARIPDEARQVVVVTGQGRDSSRSHVVLYQRTASRWEAGATWPAHNAFKGWTDDHRLGDLRSPIGVFTLSDAGGRLADPGSKLPYTRSGGFVAQGTGFEGEPLAGSFDYVIAIDYNREKGTSPQDWTRPLGASKGGGVWLHVDHGGPTQACVSLEKKHMRELLRTLDPALHPAIVMGDADSLRR